MRHCAIFSSKTITKNSTIDWSDKHQQIMLRKSCRRSQSSGLSPSTHLVQSIIRCAPNQFFLILSFSRAMLRSATSWQYPTSPQLLRQRSTQRSSKIGLLRYNTAQFFRPFSSGFLRLSLSYLSGLEWGTNNGMQHVFDSGNVSTKNYNRFTLRLW